MSFPSVQNAKNEDKGIFYSFFQGLKSRHYLIVNDKLLRKTNSTSAQMCKQKNTFNLERNSAYQNDSSKVYKKFIISVAKKIYQGSYYLSIVFIFES